MTASSEEPSGHRGPLWLIGAMVALLVLGLGIDQVASGFRTARRAGGPVDPNAVVTGAGLAFRCRDARNCWWLQAVPAFKTWNITRVVDGDAALMANLGRVTVASGTTIAVEMRGDRLTFMVNGRARRSLVDPSLRDARGTGLVLAASERTALAHWSDFSAAGSSGTATDDFERPDARRLGPTSSGPWRAVNGEWGTRDGQASVIRSVPSGWNIALTDVGTTRRASVTLTSGTRPSTVVDDFERPDSPTSLGTAGTGQRWRARRGIWGIERGTAYAARPRPNVNLALVQGGAANGRIEATMDTVAQGAGLAFRCRGPGNCWRVEAVPRFGVWNVLRVVRNQEVVVAHFEAPLAAGTSVAVEMDGPRLQFFVDGELRQSLRDPALRDVPGVGLAMATGSGGDAARWGDFRATPADARTASPTGVSP